MLGLVCRTLWPGVELGAGSSPPLPCPCAPLVLLDIYLCGELYLLDPASCRSAGVRLFVCGVHLFF